jgi:hypothetical protein
VHGARQKTPADLSGSDNTLYMPDSLAFDKKVLRTPRSKDFFHQDTMVNLFGCVPFGFLVCLRLLATGTSSPRGCVFFAIAVGFAIERPRSGFRAGTHRSWI